MIIIEPCAGLGNKLLGMSSAYAVAQKLNRELIVMWKREVGCNVKAEELFDLPFRVIEISENGYSKEPVAHFRGNQLKKKWRAKADRFLECGDVEAIKKQKGYEGLLAVIEKEPVIYIKSFGPLCELDAASLAFLKPSAGILQKGEPLFSQLGAKTVGVHVRRTDHTEAIANSPLSLFADKMRQEMTEVPGTDFFVATDDEGVKRGKHCRTQSSSSMIPVSLTAIPKRESATLTSRCWRSPDAGRFSEAITAHSACFRPISAIYRLRL